MSAVPPVKMIVGNKCDLEARRQVSSTTGQLWAQEKRCAFTETSARNQINVEETFAGMFFMTLPILILFSLLIKITAIIRAVISARATHRAVTPKVNPRNSLTSSTTSQSTPTSTSTSIRHPRPHPKATYSTMPPIARSPRSPRSPQPPRSSPSISSSPPQSHSTSTLTTSTARTPSTFSSTPKPASHFPTPLPLNAATLAYLNTDPHPTPAGYVANPTRALTPINASELSEKRTLAGGGALPKRGHAYPDAKSKSRSKAAKHGRKGYRGLGRRSGEGERRTEDSEQYSVIYTHGRAQWQNSNNNQHYYNYAQQPTWSEKETLDDIAPPRTSGLGLWSSTNRQMKRRSTLQSYGSGYDSGYATRSSGRSLLDGGAATVGAEKKRKRRVSDDSGRSGGGGGGLSKLFAGLRLRCF